MSIDNRTAEDISGLMKTDFSETVPSRAMGSILHHFGIRTKIISHEKQADLGAIRIVRFTPDGKCIIVASGSSLFMYEVKTGIFLKKLITLQSGI